MGFGSLEAALTTTADVAQIALAGGLGRAGRAAGIINGGLSGAALRTKQSGRNVSKGCINSNVCKDSITKLLKMAILHLKLCYY
jgi:hypothetical protein